MPVVVAIAALVALGLAERHTRGASPLTYTKPKTVTSPTGAKEPVWTVPKSQDEAIDQAVAQGQKSLSFAGTAFGGDSGSVESWIKGQFSK